MFTTEQNLNSFPVVKMTMTISSTWAQCQLESDASLTILFHSVLSCAQWLSSCWYHQPTLCMAYLLHSFYQKCQQVAQLWQRDRTSSIDDFKGWINFIGWRVTFRAIATWHNLRLLTQYSVMSMFTFWMAPAPCGRRV